MIIDVLWLDNGAGVAKWENEEGEVEFIFASQDVVQGGDAAIKAYGVRLNTEKLIKFIENG